MSSTAPFGILEARDLAGDVRAFVEHGLILDPWLVDLEEEAERAFDLASEDLLYQEAESLTLEHWREPAVARGLGALPLPERLAEAAAHEILLSTAAAIGDARQGRARIGEPEARAAIGRLQGFLEARDFFGLLWVYKAASFLENASALRHDGAVPEEHFVKGVLHRPWLHYRLDDELLMGLALGVYALEARPDGRWVSLTAAGEAHARAVEAVLAGAGYLASRARISQRSQYNQYEEWDDDVAAMVRPAGALRRAFTAFCALAPGSSVLEVGCGMGAQAFEGGLAAAVGPAGRLTATDVAAGMLARAEAKRRARGARHVRFALANMERLPFADATFDAAVGIICLYTADAPRALGELRRVVRPGGTVAVGEPCAFTGDVGWLLDWFRPVLDAAARHGATLRLPLFAPGQLASMAQDAGLAEIAVERHEAQVVVREPGRAVALLVTGLQCFQAELDLAPWGARNQLVSELIRRGEELCRRTRPEERTLRVPLELVKGVVPAPAASSL